MNTRRLLAAISLSSVPMLVVVGGASPVLATSTAATTTTSPTTTTSVQGSTTTTTTTGPAPTTTTTSLPTTTSTSAPLSAQGLLSSAMNAMAHERGVTWTYKLNAYGGSFNEVVHDGVHDGTMSSITSGGGIDAHVSAILDGKVFISGNALGLGQYDNFNAASAKSEANRWIVIPRSSRYFSAFSINLTMQSALQQLYVGTKFAMLSPTTVKGFAVKAVRESVSRNGTTVNETVYVRAHGAPLPVEVILSVNGIAGSIVYSNWGRPPSAHVPRPTIAFKSSWLQVG
jgi:hypothetical protein